MMPGYQAQSVRVQRGGRWLLDSLNLHLRPGRFTAICGPNGAGKTTLLLTLAGSLVPDYGRIVLDDTALGALNRERLARRRAMLIQGARMPFGFFASEIVALGRIPHEGRVSSEHNQRIVAAALAAAGVVELAGRNFLTLSGGEQQRVQIARCLAQVWEPSADGAARWLLLDEPTNALDLRHQLALMRLLRQLATQGWGVIASLHDLAQARRWADDCLLLNRGRAVAVGAVADVLTAERIAAVFEIDQLEARTVLGGR